MANEPLADPYATAKANLRDTVKWLATALAGTAAVAVGSSPLTGIGSLQLLSLRFFLAIASFFTALICLVGAIEVILQLLVGEVFSLELEFKRNRKDVDRFIEGRKNDVLPPTFDSVDDLISKRDEYAQIMRVHRNNNTSKVYKDAYNAYVDLQPSLQTIANLFALEHLRNKIHSARLRLAILTIVGAMALAVYSWSANPPKPLMQEPTVDNRPLQSI